MVPSPGLVSAVFRIGIQYPGAARFRLTYFHWHVTLIRDFIYSRALYLSTHIAQLFEHCSELRGDMIDII
jgi:hypothetical protein